MVGQKVSVERGLHDVEVSMVVGEA